MADTSSKIKKFGARIKLYRRLAGMTQTELADIIGVDVRTVQKFEAGANITLKNIISIADALKVGPGELFL